MPDTDSGHLFVVHGDLTAIKFDGVAVPTDVLWDVRSHWAPYVPERGDRIGWADEGVSNPTRVGSVAVRYVDSGFTSSNADADELARRVAAGARALAGDVGSTATSSGTRTGRPLIGMPLFGLGEGGFAHRRGAALGAIGAAVADVARSTGADVALVCHDRSDYTALQQQTASRGWDGLSPEERDEADRLGSLARDGSLALFLGAGVSMSVDLPSYEGLLRALGATESMLAHGPAEAAEELISELSEALVRKKLVELLAQFTSPSLQHALLASLRVEDVVTTNFDDLYERAARRAFEIEPAVLPWRPPGRRSAYLLKLHGDPLQDQRFVLSAGHFRAFADEHGAERSVLQALTLMGRELLFVGYSLQDPNVRAVLADTAARTSKVGATAPRIATVLDVAPPVGDAIARVERIALRRPAEADVASRRLEIFLDRLAWAAASEEAGWVLDGRYSDLVGPIDTTTVTTLRDLEVPEGSHWSGLRRMLGALGRALT